MLKEFLTVTVTNLLKPISSPYFQKLTETAVVNVIVKFVHKWIMREECHLQRWLLKGSITHLVGIQQMRESARLI